MSTSLHTALSIINQQIDLVEKLINEGADVNRKDDKQESPLDLAIKIENSSIVKLLIEKGADLKAVNKDGLTPLNLAASWTQNLHICELLIKAGADVNERSHFYEKTPLYHVSSSNTNLQICKFLLESGAEVNAKTGIGETPLCRAVTSSDDGDDILKLLIKAGADVHAKSIEGETALHVALYFHNYKAIKLLLEAGADINARNHFGKTPLNYTFSIDEDEINIFDQPIKYLKLLLEAGFDVNDDDEYGNTSLTILINSLMENEIDNDDRSFISESIEFLIAYCNINHVDEQGLVIFAELFENCHTSKNKEQFYKIVLKHIAKLKVLRLPINSRLLDTIEAYDDYRNYFTKCIEELEKARVTKPDKCWVSFLNLLVDDEVKLVKYSGNDRLVKDYEKKVKIFPVYEIELKNKMSAAIEARKLFNAAAINVSNHCSIFDPYHLIIRDVLNVLSKEDWVKLSESKRLYEAD